METSTQHPLIKTGKEGKKWVRSWLELAQVCVHWQALVLVVMKFRVVAEHCWYNRQSDCWRQLRAVR